MNNSASNNRRKMALVTGISLFLMAVSAGMALGYAFTGFYAKGDASLTLEKALANPSLPTLFIGGFVAVLLLDVVVSMALYFYFKPIHPRQSMLLSGSRILYSILLGIAILQLVFAQSELKSATPSTDSFTNHLEAFLSQWSMALIVFGIHLMLWGWMAFRSGETPKMLGALAMLAGLCYFGHHALNTFVVDYRHIGPMVEKVLALPMTLGELSLAIWMIARGGRTRSVSARLQSAS